MIVPRNRLLFWFGTVVLPFATVGAVIPSSAAPSVAIIGIFFLAAVLDAALSARRLDGLSLEFPEVVRLSKGREGGVDFTVRNTGRKAKRLRLGLAFPPEIHARDEELVVELPGGNEASNFLWPCTPIKRGIHYFKACYLEHASYMGFWARRKAVPADFEIRVYPNLLQERKSLAALFLNRGNFGIHAQRQVGQGRDFEKLREYVHGDGYDTIHWKATAKRGRPVTKVYQIERTQEVYVIIDASRLSARNWPAGGALPGSVGGYPDTILERFITSALMLGAVAERQGHLFGIVTFSNKVHRFLRAKNGKAHYNGCRDAIYTLEPQIVTPDFDELGAFMSLRLRRRALLIFLTNLDDPVLSESFAHGMDLLRRKHLVLVNMIQPPGARPIFSDGGMKSADEIYLSLGRHMLWHDLLELEKILQKKGVGFSLLDNEKMCSQLISQYLSVKQRQLL
jgi:uncharacterized protein (DUF58 family)